MTIGKDFRIKEALVILGLVAALYGGIQGVQAIAKGEAEGQIKDHNLQSQPVFEEIRTEQRVMQETLDQHSKSLERIEEKLDNID